MLVQKNYRNLSCIECQGGAGLDFDFTMAFQPIIDTATGNVFAQEALVRGMNGEPASEMFLQVDENNRYRFDQACRVKAIELASRLGIDCYLSINFMPNAVYRPELCIRTTLEAADRFGFPIDRILFEFTEGERVEDQAHLKEIVSYYQKRGFLTAIDDFGAGYSGLNLLSNVQTDLLKLDAGLVRDIDADNVRRAIVRGLVQMCRDLGIRVIAEGIETEGELRTIQALGIDLVQGFHFAQPAFQALATVSPQALANLR